MAWDKKKVSFADDVVFKTTQEELLNSTIKVGMICTINRQSFYIFTKNTWNSNLGVSCNINKDIDESTQGSIGSTSATIKGKL